jgi:hypothetical protein
VLLGRLQGLAEYLHCALCRNNLKRKGKSITDVLRENKEPNAQLKPQNKEKHGNKCVKPMTT